MTTVPNLASIKELMARVGPGAVIAVFQFTMTNSAVMFRVCYTDGDIFEVHHRSPDIRRETIQPVYEYGKWVTSTRYRLYLDILQGTVQMTPYSLREESFSHMLHDGGTQEFLPVHHVNTPLDNASAKAEIERIGEVHWEVRICGDDVHLVPVYKCNDEWVGVSVPSLWKSRHGSYLLGRFVTYAKASEVRHTLINMPNLD